MKTFKEYYDARESVIWENFIMDLADKFLSRYPGISPSHRPGITPVHRDPSKPLPSQGVPPHDVPAGKEDLGSIQYNPAIDDETPATYDPISQWDINPHNVVDDMGDSRSAAADQDLRKVIYNRIESMLRDPNLRLRQPTDVFVHLEKDPMVQRYLRNISPAQKGAFTRRANQAFSQGAMPLKVHTEPIASTIKTSRRTGA